MIQRDIQVGDAVLYEAITHAVTLLVNAYGHLPSAHIDMLTEHLKSLLAIQMERVMAPIRPGAKQPSALVSGRGGEAKAVDAEPCRSDATADAFLTLVNHVARQAAILDRWDRKGLPAEQLIGGEYSPNGVG